MLAAVTTVRRLSKLRRVRILPRRSLEQQRPALLLTAWKNCQTTAALWALCRPQPRPSRALPPGRRFEPTLRPASGWRGVGTPLPTHPEAEADASTAGHLRARSESVTAGRTIDEIQHNAQTRARFSDDALAEQRQRFRQQKLRREEKCAAVRVRYCSGCGSRRSCNGRRWHPMLVRVRRPERPGDERRGTAERALHKEQAFRAPAGPRFDRHYLLAFATHPCIPKRGQDRDWKGPVSPSRFRHSCDRHKRQRAWESMSFAGCIPCTEHGFKPRPSWLDTSSSIESQEFLDDDDAIQRKDQKRLSILDSFRRETSAHIRGESTFWGAPSSGTLPPPAAPPAPGSGRVAGEPEQDDDAESRTVLTVAPRNTVDTRGYNRRSTQAKVRWTADRLAADLFVYEKEYMVQPKKTGDIRMVPLSEYGRPPMIFPWAGPTQVPDGAEGRSSRDVIAPWGCCWKRFRNASYNTLPGRVVYGCPGGWCIRLFDVERSWAGSTVPPQCPRRHLFEAAEIVTRFSDVIAAFHNFVERNWNRKIGSKVQEQDGAKSDPGERQLPASSMRPTFRETVWACSCRQITTSCQSIGMSPRASAPFCSAPELPPDPSFAALHCAEFQEGATRLRSVKLSRLKS